MTPVSLLTLSTAALICLSMALFYAVKLIHSKIKRGEWL